MLSFDPTKVTEAKVARVTTKSYIYFRGCSRWVEEEVPTRDVSAVDMPINAWYFRFHDRLVVVMDIGGVEIELLSEPANSSPSHYPQSRVLRPDDLRRLDEERRSPMGPTFFRDLSATGFRFALDQDVADSCLYACNTLQIDPSDLVVDVKMSRRQV